jgi:hypothetical protein
MNIISSEPAAERDSWLAGKDSRKSKVTAKGALAKIPTY